MVLPGRDMPWKEFFRSLGREYTHDRVSDTAGSLTFFAVLAIFPFLLFLVSLASLVIDPAEAEALIEEVGRVAPPAVTSILGERIRALGGDRNLGLLTFSAVGAVWAASGGIDALTRALNIAYGVEESRPWWKARALAIVMTLVTTVIAVVSMLLAIALPPVAEAIGGPLGAALLWLRLPAAGLLMMFLWALLYWALPDVEQKFRLISPGSVVGVLVWLLASWAFSWYVRSFGNYEATYGALGGVIVLLLWMWISSQVVLLGAEINVLLEQRSPEGTKTGTRVARDAGTDAARSGHSAISPRPRRDPLPVRRATRPTARRRARSADGEPRGARSEGAGWWTVAGALALGALIRLIRARPVRT
jgi:membrane protein